MQRAQRHKQQDVDILSAGAAHLVAIAERTIGKEEIERVYSSNN